MFFAARDPGFRERIYVGYSPRHRQTQARTVATERKDQRIVKLPVRICIGVTNVKFSVSSESFTEQVKIDRMWDHTVKAFFKTTWEIGTTWELRPTTSVPRPIQYIVMDLRNKTISEFRTVFHSPLGVPNFQVPLYISDIPSQSVHAVMLSYPVCCHYSLCMLTAVNQKGKIKIVASRQMAKNEIPESQANDLHSVPEYLLDI